MHNYLTTPRRSSSRNDASEIQFTEGGRVHGRFAEEDPDTIILEVPVNKPPVAVPVIELFLK